MTDRAESVRVAHPLYQAEGRGSTPTSALQLRVVRVSFPKAVELNKAWHSRLPSYGRGFIKNQSDLCWAAEFDGVYYAVGIWSNPVARNLPQQAWLELRRLAVAPDAPRNTASRVLGVMIRLIPKEKPLVDRLVSYHDTEVHTGGIYRATGWTPTIVSQGTDWAASKRGRPPSQTTAPKQRWEKVIREPDQLDRTDPAGTEAGLPVPGRPDGDARKRDADRSPGLW